MNMLGPSGWKPRGQRQSGLVRMDEEDTARVIGTVCAMTGLQHQTTRFCWDLARLVMWNGKHLVNDEVTIAYHQPGFGFASEVRDNACGMFLAEDGGDWLLFLDTDNTFPLDIVKRMLDSQAEITAEHGACDILTGLYFKKWPPFEPLAYRATPDNPFAHVYDYPDVPFLVDGCGAGCLLIQRPVLQAIVERLRVAPFGWVGALHNERSPAWMERMSRNFTTEDFPFNLRCTRLGYKTWCDPRITLGHVALTEVVEEDFLPFRERLLESQKTTEERCGAGAGKADPNTADPATDDTAQHQVDGPGPLTTQGETV